MKAKFCFSHYPCDAGVYLMKDAKEKILYIGKAKNIQKRLRQHFSSQALSLEKQAQLIALVSSIDTIVVTKEKEALLLERNLIHKHRPKYNVLLKDDKSYVRIGLTHHAWPRLKILREKQNMKSIEDFFGPYPSAKAARQTLDLILRVFPLRQCSDEEFARRKRPCILYDIKKCPGPCVKKCDPKQYQSYVKGAVKLLKGKNQQVLEHLYLEMEQASKKMLFEKAQELYTIIQHLEKVLETQNVENLHTKEADVIGMYRKNACVVLSFLQIREKKLVASHDRFFENVLEEDEELLTKFLLDHYEKIPPPSLVLLPKALQEEKELAEILSCHFCFAQKGDKKRLVQMAEQNATAQFPKYFDAQKAREKALLELQEITHMQNFPHTICCFDISHIAGQDPVASMVVFENGKRASHKQRTYKVQNAHKSDDYAAMKEIVTHFLLRAKKEETFPDLLLIDGGKGHLSTVMQVLKDLEVIHVQVLGLAKEQSLHTKSLTAEKLLIPGQKDPVCLPRNSPLLFILQNIRDASHELALRFHKKRRSQKTTRSKLEDVAGIGPKKRALLLKRFGSIKHLLSLSDEELLLCPGIGKEDVIKIRKHFSN